MARAAHVAAKASPGMTAIQQAGRVSSPDSEQRRKRTRREPIHTHTHEREVKGKRKLLTNRFDCIKISLRSCWEKQN